MAVFNPTPNPTNDPEYLRYSKEPDRVQADTSAGKLAEGLGGIFGAGAKGIDLGLQDALKKQARDLIEPIRDAHGADVTPDEVPPIAGRGSRSAKFESLGVLENGDVAAVPKQFAQNVSGLQRVTDAYQSGAMSDSHYFSSLETAVKQLRNRFPGYEEQIDNAVKDITGVIPANALRSSILRDMNSLQASAGAADKDNQSWYKTDQEWIGMLYPGMSKAEAIANREKLEILIGEKKGQKQRFELQSKALELEGKIDDRTRKQHETNITIRANEIASDALQTAQRMTGKSYSQIQEEIARLGDVPDPRKLQELSNQMGVFKTQVSLALNRFMNTPMSKDSSLTPAAALQNPDRVKGITDQALSFITTSEAQIGNKNPGLANSAANIGANQKIVDKLNIGVQYPSLRAAEVINDMAGQEGMKWVVQNSKLLPDALKAATDAAIFTQIDPKNPNPRSLDSVVKGIGEATGKPADGKTQKVLLDGFLKMTEAKDPAVAAQAMKVLYQSPEFFAGLPENQKQAAFVRLANPEFTKRVLAVAETDPAVKQHYTSWVENAFGALYKQGIDDTQQAMAFNRLNVTFNPQTWQFSATLKDEYKPKQVGMSRVNADDPSMAYVQKLNAGLTMMKPVMEASYGDQALGRVFSVMTERGLNAAAPQQGTWVEEIGKAVASTFDFNNGNGHPGKETKKPRNVSDNPVMNIQIDDIPEGMDARTFIQQLQKKK